MENPGGREEGQADRLGSLGTSVRAPPRALWPGPYKQLLASALRTWCLLSSRTSISIPSRGPAAMSYPVTSQPQCTNTCYQTQLSDWHTGLTDCCNDMPVCLCGTFAPLCLACRISDDFGECCCAPYLPGGLHSLRTGMRERYHIQGSVGHDWAALTFCLPCALCQMARELKIRE
eukprot:XP_008757182.1 PREDICTED: cornifelin isoform X1 [Rattus norvegicus]